MTRALLPLAFLLALALLPTALRAQVPEIPGFVLEEQKISDGGFTDGLDVGDDFGQSVAVLGDLDDDGVTDLAVGAIDDDDGGAGRGAVWVLFLNPDGTVRDHQKISDTHGGFTGQLDNGDQFGSSVTALGDLDGDGVTDLAVGARFDDDGGTNRGAVYVLLLNPDGTVRTHQKVSDTQGGFTGQLSSDDFFGTSVAALGDLDGDGVTDLAVGARGDDDGGISNEDDRGAVWVLFLNADGTVAAHQKISDTQGGFSGELGVFDGFGTSVAALGDLDGDGLTDLAVGADGDDDGDTNQGAVYVLFLNADGTVAAHQKISDTQGGFDGALDFGDAFGTSVAALSDLDGDGVTDLAVGARFDDDGGDARGAVWVLFLSPNGTVASHQKISDTQGGFTGALGDGYFFGTSVAALGDLDGDGIPDLAVGVPLDEDSGVSIGAVWVLFLSPGGTVAAHQKISSTEGRFQVGLDDNDFFGQSVATVGDLDGDGIQDLAVGVSFDDDGGFDRGAVRVLYMRANGTVRSQQKISDTQGGFTGALDDFDQFGQSVAALGDLDGDGIPDLAVGASSDDDGGSDRGTVWVLFLNPDGTVRTHQKISDTQGGFAGQLDNLDGFGASVAALGDLDGDGLTDLAVGAVFDDDGGTGGFAERGAVWVLFLNPDGTVRDHQKISDTQGGFTGALDDFDQFGQSVAALGDLDGDGIPDLAVGTSLDDDGGTDHGAVWVLFLNPDGTVASHQKISDTEGGFTATLDDGDLFGQSVAALGDLDGDGIPDLAVGTSGDDDDDGGQFSNFGAIYVLFLDTDGSTRFHQKISDESGGFNGPLDEGDQFGWSVAALGDLDGDGIPDLAAGANGDDDGGNGRGAVWVLLLDGEAPATMNFDLTVTPTGPLSTPPGGQFSFAYTIANNTAASANGDFYFVAQRNGNTVAQAVIRSGTLPGGQTLQGNTTLNVGGSTPPGTYALTFSIGRAFNQAVDSEAFTVTVEGATLRAGAATWGVAYASPWTPAAATASATDGPESFALHPAYPNPFGARTQLRYEVPVTGRVRLAVYDVLGREVAVLVDDEREAGPHTAVFDGSGLPSGVYLVRLEAGGRMWTRRVTLAR